MAFSNTKLPRWIFLAAKSENSRAQSNDPLTLTKSEYPERRGTIAI
jgi:hypothetical protein